MSMHRISRMMAGFPSIIPQIHDESAFREHVKDIFDRFTVEETIKIAFVPLVISHVAWHYTELVVNECVAKRIPATVPLTRAVRNLRQMYIFELRKDLKHDSIEHVEAQCNEFLNECAYDFTILWWSVNQALKTLYPEDTLTDLRTNAYCAIIAIRVLRDHVMAINDEIRRRGADELKRPMNPHMKGLEVLLDAYMADFKIEETENIRMCRKIFSKNIGKIEFGLIDENK